MTTSSPSAQIGRYGTLSLMKRQEPSIALTAFGIDTPELTFGRDPSCGVRLYYTEIAVVHCRIVFDDDRKAFMSVLGDSGVVVDGCYVKGGGEMVPLMNGSEFEIRGKKFRFTYPPKEIRAALYASPLPTRTPRLSLITSTHVFSPRPSSNPRENLRILQSPLKNTFKAPNRSLTPLRTTLFANASSKYAYNSPVKPIPAPPPDEEEEEEEDIVLVDGNHPRVVEDEKDLVILEDIDHAVPFAHSQQHMLLHAPQPRLPEQQQPKTPVRRRSQSLHRAVLIRSAQRAVLKAERDEREKEEAMEEMEVLDVVAGLEGEDNGGEKGHTREQEYEHEYEEDIDMDVDMDVEMEEPLAGGSDDDGEGQEEREKHEPKQKLSWRKSFERLWPFRSSSPAKDEENTSDDEDEDENGNEIDNEYPAPAPTSSSPTDGDTDEEDENEHPAPLFTPRTPLRPQHQQHNRTLGPFMTPQPRIGASVSDPTLQRTHEQNLGAGLGRATGRFSLGGEARRVIAESQVWRVRDIVVPPPSPAVGSMRSGPLASPARPVASPRKIVVGDEERKAIQERRRSALREPSGLGFVPGFSPMKSGSLVFPGAARPSSPTKSSAPPTLPALPAGEKEEEQEDTRKLLEKMKETVEGMKRRRSEVLPAPVMPVHSTPFTPGRGRSPSKKGEMFSLLRTEAKEEGDAKENEVLEVPPSLKENEARKDKSLLPVLVRGDESVGLDVPIDADEEPAKPRSRSKPKTPVPVTVAVRHAEVSPTPTREKPRSRSKAKSPAPVAVEDVPMDEDDSRPDEPEREPEVSVVPEPAEESEVKHDKPPSKTRSRSKSMLRASGRTTKVAPAPEPRESVEEPQVRGRKAARSTSAAEQEREPEPVKRGRKATTTTTTTPATATAPVSSSSAQDEHAPTRRGRKPTVEPEEAPKRGRKLGVTTVVVAAAKEAEAPKRGVRKTPASTTLVVENAKDKEPVKRGRTPRAGSAVPVSKAETQAGEAEEEKKVTVKGRRRAGTIKKEDDAESASGESVNTPVPAAVTTKARTPALGTRTRKIPASAPAVPIQEVNKENENGEEEVKVRVSRKGRAKKDVSTQEDDELEVETSAKEKGVKEAVKGRVGRATRARTRT